MRIGKSIYLDHQSTTPVDPQVKLEMEPYLSDIFGNPHSSEHSFGWGASKAIDKARADVADLIGADPDEIIFTSGATEANNLVLFGLLDYFKSFGRRKLLISPIEHKSVINLANEINSRKNFEFNYLDIDDNGQIKEDQLEFILEKRDVSLVSISAVNNEIGTIQNIENISSIVRKYGALLHMDASQAPCAMDLDVNEFNVDLMSLSAHKIYGPKGIGALYVRRDLQQKLKPLIIGGGQENNLRGGTLPTHQCVGFGAAARVLKAHTASGERERLRVLKALFLSELAKSDINFAINGPPESQRHPGNLNVCFHGCVAQDLLMAMQPYVAASSGSACNSGVVEPSYVLRAIGLSEDEARASVRFSVGRYTTEEDIVTAVGHIKSAFSSLYG